jgi:UDP-N-acetylmuramoyl-tripeptide--D-alanyl-D-alanine ligase
MQRCYKSGITLLNDAYNANPMSVRAALDLLARADCGGKKVAFLGDMLG